MVAFLEEEEAKLHERRLKERSNIQGLEVHGKSKEKEYKMMIKEMCLVELSLRALNKQENDGTIAAADNCIRDLTEVVKSMAHMQKIQHIAVEEGASTARGFQEGKFSFSLTENDAKGEKRRRRKRRSAKEKRLIGGSPSGAKEEQTGVTTVMRSVISPGIAPETALPSPRWGRGRKSSPSRLNHCRQIN